MKVSQCKVLFCHEGYKVNVELSLTLKSYYMYIINPSLLMVIYGIYGNSKTSESVAPILNMRKPTRKSSSTNMGKHFPAKNLLLFNMNLHLTL